MFEESLTRAANTSLLLASRKNYRNWKRATYNVQAAQRQILFRILARNTETSFGKSHGFSDIATIEAYQQSIPIRTYEEFKPWIQRAAAGEQHVLTASPILMFEPSSGSASASKLIPYTEDLKEDFQQGIDPWIYALLTAHPRLLATKQYWSITPVASEKSYTAGRIPIGFEEDSEYFGAIKRKLIQAVMAVPSAVRRIRDLETFRYVTLRFLLGCRDLGLISVWNPTFLLLLLEKLPDWMPKLIADIAHGSITIPDALERKLLTEINTSLTPNPKRAQRLSLLWESFQANVSQLDTKGRTFYEAVWPNLVLISCWADAFAKEYADKLGIEGIKFAEGNSKVLSDYKILSTTTKYALDKNGVLLYKGSGAFNEKQWEILFNGMLGN